MSINLTIFGKKLVCSKLLVCVVPLFLFSIMSTSCTGFSSSSQNLVLQGTPFEDFPILDPTFLTRQKLAEESFFGLDQNNNDTLSNTDEDLDDESMSPQQTTKHAFEKGSKRNFQDQEFNVIWPTNGTLTSLFGMRKLKRLKRMHTGIDIGARSGTPIYASAAGQVLFSGKKRGYGSAVIVGHDNFHETLYAHMSKIAVKNGQLVKRNQLVGYVGHTGRAFGSNLHFETRIKGIAYDPLTFLPSSTDGSRIKVGTRTPSLEKQLSIIAAIHSTTESSIFEN